MSTIPTHTQRQSPFADQVAHQAEQHQQHEQEKEKDKEQPAEQSPEAAAEVAQVQSSANRNPLERMDRLAHQAGAQMIKLAPGPAWDRLGDFTEVLNAEMASLTEMGCDPEQINSLSAIPLAALDRVNDRAGARAKILASEVHEEAAFSESPIAPDAVRADYVARAGDLYGDSERSPDLKAGMAEIWASEHMDPLLGVQIKTDGGNETHAEIDAAIADDTPANNGG